jgi:hypothetical protein
MKNYSIFIAILISINILFTTNIKATSEWNCQSMIVELNNELTKTVNLSTEKKERILNTLQKDVKNIKTLCENREIYEDFDLDGAVWWGLNNIEKKSIN